jgi:hypothetical protein
MTERDGKQTADHYIHYAHRPTVIFAANVGRSPTCHRIHEYYAITIPKHAGTRLETARRSVYGPSYNRSEVFP